MVKHKNFIELPEIDSIMIAVPADCTWYSVGNNDLGSFINESLKIKSQQFLSYGKEGVSSFGMITRVCYHNPDTFYLPKGQYEISGIISREGNTDFDIDLTVLIDNEVSPHDLKENQKFLVLKRI